MPAASALTGFVLKSAESSVIIFGVMLMFFSEAAVVQDWNRPKIRRAVKKCFIVVISCKYAKDFGKIETKN
jgi:hypothetical protein